MTDHDVTIKIKDKKYFMPGNITLKKAFKILNLNGGSYLAICNEELITDDIIIKPGATIKLINVISGG